MQTEWIAVDWGTSNLRVWVFGPDGQMIDHTQSDQGMGRLAPEQFEPTLLQLIETHLPTAQVTPVICCGMAGARQGWAEAPYAAVPCAPPGLGTARQVDTMDPRLSVFMLPGLSQATPPDVMRGEETQIAGFLAQFPDFDGVICLPGTHTKWVHVSAGEIVSFRSFMTGELFALLAGHSVLRHSVNGDGWDDAAFAAAVEDAMTAPQQFTTRLFSLRAASLLDGVSAATSRARLSGWLIGMELAGAKPYWLGQDVAIIGTDSLSGLYAKALEGTGVVARRPEAELLTLAGLAHAYAQWKGQSA